MLLGLVRTVFGVIWAVVLVLVGGRFLALLANANRDSEIIQRLYDWSEFWVQPFFGILNLSNEAVNETGGVFEPASLIAFVVYFLLGLAVLALLGVPLGGWRRTA
ncbi:MAG TPA: hypothetical protein VIO14_11000 [Dehalococcoidia bacterium]